MMSAAVCPVVCVLSVAVSPCRVTPCCLCRLNPAACAHSKTVTQRIRAGKELLEAKRKEEDGAMRRLVEERKREKEEEARAR